MVGFGVFWTVRVNSWPSNQAAPAEAGTIQKWVNKTVQESCLSFRIWHVFIVCLPAGFLCVFFFFLVPNTSYFVDA